MVLNFLKINFTTFEEIKKNFFKKHYLRLQILKTSREESTLGTRVKVSGIFCPTNFSKIL